MNESIGQFFGTTTKLVDLDWISTIVEILFLFSETIELFLSFCILGLYDSKLPASLDV